MVFLLVPRAGFEDNESPQIALAFRPNPRSFSSTVRDHHKAMCPTQFGPDCWDICKGTHSDELQKPFKHSFGDLRPWPVCAQLDSEEESEAKRDRIQLVG